MLKKPRFSRFSIYSAGLFSIFILLVGTGFLQVKPDDPAIRHPEIPGIYEMTIPGQGKLNFQVYFKDGSL